MLKIPKSWGKLWLASLASALLVMTPGAQAQIIDGLVAHWDFDGNLDDTLGTWSGEAVESITYVDGQPSFGSALKLDGSGHVAIPGSAEAFQFAGGSMSISAWFKVDAFDLSWQAIISKGEGTNWRVARRDASDSIAYAGGAAEPGASAPNVNDGAWHHFAAITDAASGTYLWVDGEMYEHQTTLPVLDAGTLDILIGENPGATGRRFKGELDEIGIWNRVLTEDEIALLSTAALGTLLDDPNFVTFRSATADAASVSVVAADVGTAVVNPSTITVTLDGEPITAAVSKEGNLTTISYNYFAATGEFFESGSAHQIAISLEDTTGNPWSTEQTFTVAAYPTIPPAYALAAAASTPGFVVTRVHQMNQARTPGDANITPNAEMQIAGGMTDAQGNLLPNNSEFATLNFTSIPIGGTNPGGATEFVWTPYVNWEQAASQINLTGAQPDNFNAVDPDGEAGTLAGAYANNFFPGVDPGQFGDPDNFVVETIAYVDLPRGLHRWGVNSDDGFKVSVAPGQPSPFGITLGEYSGGRGASDTIFDFVVEEDGVYPIRILNWDGTGGGNAEWFSVDLESGQKILIGDTQYYPADAYEAFRTGQGRAHISSMRPSNGYAGARENGPIVVQITDGRTQASNAQLLLDGVEVATGTKAGNVTTIEYTPPSAWAFGTTISGQIVYTESGEAEPITQDFSFSVRPFTLSDLPADTFWIEAEDWDHSNGQTVPAASTMPYAGGAYAGLAGVVNVDYFDDNSPSADDIAGGVNLDYRTDQTPNHVNITVHQGAGVLAVERPNGFTMTTNYRLGWAGNFWGNYTRTIPAGNYRGVAALSHGDGTGIVMEADLDRIIEGVGTADQTLQRIGIFTGSGSTGWGSSVLVPLKTPSGSDAIFSMPGGPVTLRVTARNGDFDWFALMPTTEAVPPTVQIISPSDVRHTVFRDTTIQVQVDELTSQVEESGISMTFDGQAVTPQFSRNESTVTITYDPPGLLNIGQEYPFSITVEDNATPSNSQTLQGRLVPHYLPASPEGMFLIEAEDFNHGGGNIEAAVNTMPYLGNAYDGLSAVAGTDYIRVGDEPLDGGALAGNVYRLDESPNVPMGANNSADVTNPIQVFDLVRAMDADRNVTWQMDVNFALGWSGQGHWFNYTRNIPNGTYQIWAAMSFDGTGEGQLSATLDEVTSSASVPDAQQVKQPLGSFNAPGTGGWGNNRLVPLRDTATSAIKAVELGGNTTLRLNWASGDWDYMMLVPTALTPGGLTVSIDLQPDGMLRLEWEGDGVLQSTTSIPSDQWTDRSETSPAVIDPPATGNLFFRVQE
jgi:hypothetical protein